MHVLSAKHCVNTWDTTTAGTLRLSVRWVSAYLWDTLASCELVSTMSTRRRSLRINAANINYKLRQFLIKTFRWVFFQLALAGQRRTNRERESQRGRETERGREQADEWDFGSVVVWSLAFASHLLCSICISTEYI